MNGCPFCLGPSLHPQCALDFHGTTTVPVVAVRLDEIDELIGAQAEKIGGVQPKFIADVTPDGSSLVPAEGGAFIVKPQWAKRAHLPENEHLSMCLARSVGVSSASCALLTMADGSLAYVAKRFDRDDSIPAVVFHQLDFCQLLNLPQEGKYDRAANVCIDVLRESSVDVRADLKKLFSLFVFSYWMGCGDLHLKNLSLLDRNGFRLAPAYDMACSYIYNDKKLALRVENRQKDVRRADWMAFAKACDIATSDAAAIIDSIASSTDAAVKMVRRSSLPMGHKPAFERCLRKRRRSLLGWPPPQRL